MMRVYEQTGTGVVALERIPRDEIHRYGVIAAHERQPHTYEITDMVEKQPLGTAPSDLAIIGRYTLPQRFFLSCAMSNRVQVEKSNSPTGSDNYVNRADCRAMNSPDAVMMLARPWAFWKRRCA
jgi:hypothetical protein